MSPSFEVVNSVDEKFFLQKIPSPRRRDFVLSEISNGDVLGAEADTSEADSSVCRHDKPAGAEVSEVDNNVCRYDKPAVEEVVESAAGRNDISAGRSDAFFPILCGRGVRFRFRVREGIYL